MVKSLLVEPTSLELPSATGSLRSALWRAATSTRSLSIVGVAIWVPLGLVRGAARQAPNGFTVGIGRFLLGLVALVVIAIVASWLVRKTILRKQSSYRSTVIRTFFAYLTTLGVVGISQLLLSFGADIGPSFSVARVLPSLFLLYVVGCLLDYFDDFRANLRALIDEQANLTSLREHSAEQLFEMRNDIIDRLQLKVWPAMRELTFGLDRLRNVQAVSAYQLISAASEIREKLIRTVREFSYDVQDTSNTTSLKVRRRFGKKPVGPLTDWRRVLITFPMAQPFRPLLVALTLFVSTIGNIEHVNPYVAFIGTTAAAMCVAIVLLTARALVTPLLQQINSIVGWLICIAVYTVAAGSVFIPLYWTVAFAGYPHPGGVVVSSVAVLLLCLVWGLLGSAQQNAAEVAASLQQMISLTRLEVAALERERDLELTSIAHQLHGEVQSMLTAAAFRLNTTAEKLMERTAGASVDATEAIDQALLMIDDAFDKITSIKAGSTKTTKSDISEPDIVEEIFALAASWRGIIDIAVNIDEHTAPKLNTRFHGASLAPAVVDIVREAILNATRHALAAKVWVEITDNGKACLITVENDGDVPDEDARPGLGQQLLNNLRCTWSLSSRQPDGGVLKVSLPLLQPSDT